MVNWYLDSEVSIDFSETPHVGIRYIMPSDSEETKKSVKKYPFINKRDLTVRLGDIKNERVYEFGIPKGYCYDGASIPRLFWRVIGSPTDNSFLIAALVHDVLCENHQYVMNDRIFSTKVFNALLKASQVGKIKRFLMKNSVDIFQKLCCHW